MKVVFLALLTIGCGSDGKLESSPSDDETVPTEEDNPVDVDTGSESDTAGPDAGCPEDIDVFEERVWDPVLSVYCQGCHSATGPASTTRMVFDESDMLHNLRAASRVADVLLLKPTGMHEDGHGGGELVLPESEAWEALSFWVNWTRGMCEDLDDGCEDEPLPRRLWRLDHEQYERTVRDLLGVSADYGQSFAADVQVDGFANDVDALLVSGLLADQYRNAAEEMASVADIATHLDCVPEEGSATQCAAEFIERMGTRAFRRPLSADELGTYLELWAEVAADDGFFEGLRWVITGFLQSPHFLYRSELGTHAEGGIYQLTDWEIASELSYLLWGTMPDETLFDAAAAGELNTPDQIRVQVDRMMEDERTLETAANFMDVWLHLDRLMSVSRVGFSSELQAAMVDQSRETMKTLSTRGAALSDLVAGHETYLPPELASHYGAADAGWIEQDGENYGGLLTHGSFLTVYALSDGSSPVHRGVAVRERMLCEPLPPPPANLDTSPPAADADGTTREKYTVHSSLPECASCHDLIDPIGFGFEHYDHLGRYREEEVGQPVDATGAVDGVTFDGAQDLAEVLLDDPRFRACYVETWRRWGTGTESCADDEGDVGLLEPLRSLPSRVGFTQRSGEASEGDTCASGDRLTADQIHEIAMEEGEILPGGASVGIEFSLVETTTWVSGFCADGTVTNTTAEPVLWEVREHISGTITSIWNAEYEVVGDEHVFTGVDWNEELAPFGSTTFGFCGER
jgi:hypothetical protein